MSDLLRSRRSVRLRIPDRPGALAEVTAVLAGFGIDIVRLEVWPGSFAEVDDDVTLEATDAETISRALRD